MWHLAAAHIAECCIAISSVAQHRIFPDLPAKTQRLALRTIAHGDARRSRRASVTRSWAGVRGVRMLFGVVFVGTHIAVSMQPQSVADEEGRSVGGGRQLAI
jgi:hypothetical protein